MSAAREADRLEDEAPPFEPECLIPWKFMLISQHVKKIVGCPYHTRPYGDLERNTLAEIWNGPIAQSMRESLLAGRVPQFCLNHSAACPVITKRKAEAYSEPAVERIDMGSNDAWMLGEGWYGLENIPEPIRWTSARCAFRLRTAGKKRLHLRVLSTNPDVDDDVPLTGIAAVAGVSIGRFAICHVGWTRLDFLLPPGATGDDSHVTLEIDNPWSPSDVIGNGDTRRLGVAVNAIWST
jgi:hypothetical protein